MMEIYTDCLNCRLSQEERFRDFFPHKMKSDFFVLLIFTFIGYCLYFAKILVSSHAKNLQKAISLFVFDKLLF